MEATSSFEKSVTTGPRQTGEDQPVQDRGAEKQQTSRDKIQSHPRCVEASWNVMAHAQKPDFIFRRNGRVHLNRRWRQFSRLLAAEVCASAVVMLDTPCSEAVWRVLATHSLHQFPLHLPSRASPCAITFQLESTNLNNSKPLLLPTDAHNVKKSRIIKIFQIR